MTFLLWSTCVTKELDKILTISHSEQKLLFLLKAGQSARLSDSIYILTSVARVLASMGRLPFVLERADSLARHSSMTMTAVLDVELALVWPELERAEL